MKRFTETTKWTVNPWFRKLPPRLKCLWLVLLDSCDAAGVIDPDWELVSFQIGENVGPEDLISFADRVQKLPNGKLFITGFIAFQHGELSAACKPHIPVFKSIEANGLQTLWKGFAKGMESLEVKVNVQETGKERHREPRKVFQKPTIAEIEAYGKALTPPFTEAAEFFDHYTGNGWKAGKVPMSDWQATVRNWHRRKNHGSNGPPPRNRDLRSDQVGI